MTIGEKIYKRRKELGLTLEQVGNLVGVSKSTVKKWETGYIENMKRDKIYLLSEALQVSPSFIMGWENNSGKNIFECKNIILVPEMKSIPLLGAIACGEPILAAENIEEYLQIPKNINADFALQCSGDSMINARIFDGDIVYIHQQPCVDNGQIAAVLIGDEATLKRVYLYNNKIVL
ncbi:MAG: S24 family peptidase, partial [Oscillospiraceae bacterium]